MIMKQRYFKHILPAVLLTAAGLGMGSCVNDLDIQPIDPQQPAYNIDQNFAFAYSLLGSEGNLGLSSDEDKAGFYRTVFSLQEYPADGVIWQWQENAGIPALTNLSWDNGTNIPEWAWLRLGYDVTQYNLLLGNLAGKDDAESVRRRAEVRFLRALHYWYNLDLWGVAPVKEVFDNNNPVPKAGQELFDYIVAELKAVEPDLYAPGQAPFGRADRSACWLLLARLYLNAEVYTGTAHWAEAREYANKVLTDGYHHLTNNYKALFMADNDVNMAVRPEIVFPIRQDGTRMKEASSAAKFLVCASRDGAKPVMPDLSSNTWNCLLLKSSTLLKFFPTLDDVPYLKPEDFKSEYENFSRQEVIAFDREHGIGTDDMVAKAGDDRALFYGGVGGGKHSVSNDRNGAQPTDNFAGDKGLRVVKWSNLRSDGKPASDPSDPDTDVPLFRTAEAQLIVAETYFREGNKAEAVKAIAALQQMRNRKDLVTSAKLDADYLLDEWCREFYWEGRRRSDLRRFGKFTSSDYLWEWKGGVKEGRGVDDKYNTYPIPAQDYKDNPNYQGFGGTWYK